MPKSRKRKKAEDKRKYRAGRPSVSRISAFRALALAQELERLENLKFDEHGNIIKEEEPDAEQGD